MTDVEVASALREAARLDRNAEIARATRLGLAAARKRGVLLGGARRKALGLPCTLPRTVSIKGSIRVHEQTLEADSGVLPKIRVLHAQRKTLRAIADVLNREGLTTRCGMRWGPVQVKRVLNRAKVSTKRFEGIART